MRAPPRFESIVLASSADGIAALTQILASFPAGWPVPVAIVQHRTTSLPDYLPRVLARSTPLAVELLVS